MAHPLLDNSNNGMWSQHAKATLQLEIERGYQDLKEFPLVEGSLKSKEHNIKSREEVTALKRLSDMYEDPNFGPDFFLKTTKAIRNYLRLYRLSKNNPTQFGRFFHCSTPSPGIVLHFNSVTAKKELFILLPSGGQPRQKPAKLHIAHIIKWHKNRKAKAAAIRDKKLKAKLALSNELIQAQQEQIDVMRTFISLPPLEDSLDQITPKITQFMTRAVSLELKSKMETRSITSRNLEMETKRIISKNPEFKKLMDGMSEYAKSRENTNIIDNDFEALNPRMYGKKEFLQMRIDHSKTLTKCYLDHGKQLQNILSLISKMST